MFAFSLLPFSPGASGQPLREVPQTKAASQRPPSSPRALVGGMDVSSLRGPGVRQEKHLCPFPTREAFCLSVVPL